MFKYNLIFIFFFLFFFITKNTLAENSVVYLNLDFILSNSNPGKLILKNLKDKENKKIDEFKLSEKELKNEENKILASKSLITQEALNLNISNFKKKLDLYKEYKSKEIENLEKYRNDEIIKFINLIKPIIENFMQKNSISIVLDKKNIFIANKNYDITDEIIKEIDKNSQ